MINNLLKISILALLISTGSVYAGAMGNIDDKTTRNLYLGAFGGWTSFFNTSISQSAVAYNRIGEHFQGHSTVTTENYDLFVNVNGKTDSNIGGLAGLHAGYKWNEIRIGNKSNWEFLPAVELEGYYLGTKMSGILSNPYLEPSILDNGEVSSSHSIDAGLHVFSNSFNSNLGVFLANAVFTFKSPDVNKILPFIGGGIGVAYNSISKVNSAQIGPYTEYSPYINHFNSDISASSTNFAAQGKAGLRTELTEHISLFGQYIYLYVSPSSYTFGKTNYPDEHVATSNWKVRLGSMSVQSAVFGIDYLC